MRQKLFDLMSQEIEAGIRSILCDVERHLIAEETQLNLQVRTIMFISSYFITLATKK